MRFTDARDFDPDTAIATKVVTTLDVQADRVPDFVTVNGVEFRPSAEIERLAAALARRQCGEVRP